ncbi:MAG TPA: L,D-transpeptidase [Verrucomicrobiota bacterium]|nr:L,D-transpeptidase [Verrucomicrobiota bacterium]
MRRTRWRSAVVGLALLVLAAGIVWWWGKPLKTLVPALHPAVSTTVNVPPAVLEQVLPPPPIPVPTPVPMPSPVLVATNPLLATPAVTNRPPIAIVEADLTQVPDRSPTNILEAQIAMTSYGIGSGPIDGIGGAQTAWALRAFQFQHGLDETGRLDRETQTELKPTKPWFRTYAVTANDLAGLNVVPGTWLGKSEMNHLGFQNILELVAEQAHASGALLRRLNPEVNWQAIAPGTQLVVPNAEYPPPRRAALIRISLANRYLRAFDGRGNLLAHFPCSIGRIAEKRPVGELQVMVTAENPNYTFDPAVFPESAEARQLSRKLIIPPGPNNPVGVAWIGLNRPGYGIHGTPSPEQVGRTESHGCFRLANWNAAYLLQMVVVGTPVWVEL